MAQYKTKPEYVEAVRWFKVGDHPLVTEYPWSILSDYPKCHTCGENFCDHGWINTYDMLDRGIIVCPGEWVVERNGKLTMTATNDAFNESFEKV